MMSGGRAEDVYFKLLPAGGEVGANRLACPRPGADLRDRRAGHEKLPATHEELASASKQTQSDTILVHGAVLLNDACKDC